MNETEWKIPVGDDATRAVYEPATSANEKAVYVFAHGAGGNMADRSMLAAAKELRNRGFGVVRFNFLYKERGSGRPDPMPRLMNTVTAVVERTRAELGSAGGRPLIIGGRSMGGRAASMLAADDFDADGLLLLAYPLHPDGQPEKLRDAHLPRIKMPVLCINGTRDGLCRRDLMERAVGTVTAPWEMHWLDGADHSFHVLKSSGRNDAAVVAEVGDVSERWLSGLMP
ncbi:MAG TPA: alpha/beta family hydrolase [Gemmatimonadaceae bacterium]|nr:alpha/beta family hydrolase [Gemmatimonadaceae bacterium]